MRSFAQKREFEALTLHLSKTKDGLETDGLGPAFVPLQRVHAPHRGMDFARLDTGTVAVQLGSARLSSEFAFCEQTLLLLNLKWKLSVRCADRGGRLCFLGVLFDLFLSALLHTAILDLTPR